MPRGVRETKKKERKESTRETKTNSNFYGVSSVDRREIMTQALITIALMCSLEHRPCQRAGLVSFITENQEEERGEHGAGGGE